MIAWRPSMVCYSVCRTQHEAPAQLVAFQICWPLAPGNGVCGQNQMSFSSQIPLQWWNGQFVILQDPKSYAAIICRVVVFLGCSGLGLSFTFPVARNFWCSLDIDVLCTSNTLATPLTLTPAGNLPIAWFLWSLLIFAMVTRFLALLRPKDEQWSEKPEWLCQYFWKGK